MIERFFHDRRHAMRGLSDAYGILKDDLHVPPRRRAGPCENDSTSSPLNHTSPDVGSISRRMQRPVVVLPLPDSPTSPKVSPSSIAKTDVVHGGRHRGGRHTRALVRTAW